MFHPAANRLAGFLEISALMITLAQSGGAQYKAGLLRTDAVGNKAGLGRRGTPRKEKNAQKWCSVRESYLVIHEEMGEVDNATFAAYKILAHPCVVPHSLSSGMFS